jgi:type II secretory pathway pseudopilin PulG
MRRGATLLEVLVAIFVMGIGLLALLTLFPLGALRMAQAIQDERCAQACRLANAFATLHGVRSDRYILDQDTRTPTVTDPFFDPKWTSAALKTADPDGPSYPVFVDPAGYLTAFNLPSEKWLAGIDDTIRRRTVSFVQTKASPSSYALRWFTLLDDIIFDTEGKARDTGTGTIERDIRYSWAYLLRRPRTSNYSVVDMTVVVFNRRTLALSSNLDLSESLYQGTEVTFDPARNTITLDPSATSVLPTARPGDWLLDATYIPNIGNSYGTVNGYFYRIVGMTETSTTGMEYEVMPELRNFPATNSATAVRKVVFMEGVAEVFEKGVGRLP